MGGGIWREYRSECVMNFVGLLSLSRRNEREILSDDEICYIKEESLEVNKMKMCGVERTLVCE